VPATVLTSCATGAEPQTVCSLDMLGFSTRKHHKRLLPGAIFLIFEIHPCVVHSSVCHRACLAWPGFHVFPQRECPGVQAWERPALWRSTGSRIPCKLLRSLLPRLLHPRLLRPRLRMPVRSSGARSGCTSGLV